MAPPISIEHFLLFTFLTSTRLWPALLVLVLTGIRHIGWFTELVEHNLCNRCPSFNSNEFPRVIGDFEGEVAAPTRLHDCILNRHETPRP